MTERQEIEIKLEAASPEELQEFRESKELFPGYLLAPMRTKHFTDLYCDTPDFALLRAGFALRIRAIQEAGGPKGKKAQIRYGVSAKSLDRPGVKGLHSRREVEGPLTGPKHWNRPEKWPRPLQELLQELGLADIRVTPLARIEQRRDTRELLHTNRKARCVGELSADTVTVYEPDPADPWGPAPAVARFAELEIEVGDAFQEDGASLKRLRGWVKKLRRRPGLRPARNSKFERALRLIASHPPGGPVDAQGVQPRMPMAEAGRLVWRRQLVEMLLNEAGAREGQDIEYVHDMRVATRRARAAGDVFGPFFRRKGIKPYLKGLRKTARRLGAVRDLDVALEALERYRKKRPKAEQKALDALAAAWQEERSQAHEQLLEWLDSEEYRAFLVDFHRFCRTPGEAVRPWETEGPGAPPPYQVRHVMPVTILDRYQQVRAYQVLFEEQQKPALESFHALRVEGKRLRYSLEFVRHLLGAPGETLIRQLKRFQDHLGDLNDAVVARARLEAVIQAGLDKPAIRHYRDAQEATIQELTRTFPPVWEGFIARKNRQILARAIIQL